MRKKRKMEKVTVKQEVPDDPVIKQEAVSDEDNLDVAKRPAEDTTQIEVKIEDQREMNIEIELDIKPILGTQECNIGGNIQSTSLRSHVKQEQSVEDIMCKSEEVDGDNKLFNTQDFLDIEETQLVATKLMISSTELMTADDSSNLEEAGSKVAEKPYKCNLCEKSFARKNSLKLHSTVHSDDRPYECGICGLKSKGLGNHREHVETHASVKYTCEICHIKYSHRSSYLSHVKKHSYNVSKKIKCEICHKSLNKFVIEAHMRKHSNYTYMCDHCDYKTAVKGHIQRHMQKHGFVSFICDICHKSLSDNSTLKIHKLTHTGIKPCQKSFIRPDYLKIHQALHSEDKPFKCKMCNYQSQIEGNLQKHIVRHQKVRPHKCDLCNFAFKNPKSLEKHKLCHTDGDDKPFRCVICCKWFSTKEILASHTKALSHIRALQNEIYILPTA